MKRLPVLLCLVALSGTGALAHGPGHDFYVSVDVPADVSLPPGSTTVLPWRIARHQTCSAVGYEYTTAIPFVPSPGPPVPPLPLPAPPTFPTAPDALHLRHDRFAREWLFSVAAPIDDPSGVVATFLPGDVIVYNDSAGTYSKFFCSTLLGLADGANLDAVFLEDQDDKGALIVSYDVPVDVPGAGLTAQPGDLLRFTPAAGPPCADWAFAGLKFDSSAPSAACAPGVRLPLESNVTGADETGSGADYRLLLTLDIPTDDPGGGGTEFLPGDVVEFEPATCIFGLYHRDATSPWPVAAGYTARLNALSMLAAPGRIPCEPPDKLEMSKDMPDGSQLTLFWSESCSVGAENYSVHEGVIGTWYSHDELDCDDGAPYLEETIFPPNPSDNNYYLVVPYNPNEEGSYGTDFIGGINTERPPSPAPKCSGQCNSTLQETRGCP